MEATPHKPDGGAAIGPMSGLMDANRIAREKLINEMSGVISDADSWLKDAGTRGDEDIVAFKDKFEAKLQTAKMTLQKLDDNLVAKSRVAAKATDAYVKHNPWTVIALGAASGLAMGWVIGRK